MAWSKMTRHRNFLIFNLLMLLAWQPESYANEEVTVVVEHWPPWEIAKDEKKEMVTEGVAIDLVKEMLDRLGLVSTLQTVPWKRAITNIRRGKADLIPMISKNQEREKYMLFTDLIYKDTILLTYSNMRFPIFEWHHWKDLSGYSFQVVNGYNYGHSWDEAATKYKFKVTTSISDMQSVRMLLGGRIDFIPVFNSTRALLKEIPGFDSLKFAKKPIYETKLYFGISKKSPLASKLTEINGVIKSMKVDGTFNRILGSLAITRSN